MKAALILALSLTAPSALAASAWQDAATAATADYRADFQSERGQPASEPVGFALSREGDELGAKVYFLDAGVLRSYSYGCHGHGSFHCHLEDRGEHGAYSRSSSRYKAEEMARAIAEALDMFTRKVGPESSIQSMKLWEAAHNVNFSIEYLNPGRKLEFMACHYHHGDHMDCHRKGSASPGEPEKL